MDGLAGTRTIELSLCTDLELKFSLIAHARWQLV